jgi:hypothetical protein
MHTHASCKAPRLGQAIHPILIHVFYRKFIGRRKSSCAGVFRCQRRYVRSFFEARRSSLASLQSGTRGIERRKFSGARRSIPMSSFTVSHFSHWQHSRRYSTKRNGGAILCHEGREFDGYLFAFLLTVCDTGKKCHVPDCIGC